jgi:eukaryotic-like serine/threonine-protein kinase
VSAERLATALADRYRIERELGQGGMATVYLAEDLKHGRKVAIKVLRPELAAVIGADRFVREIRTIAALQHPHILGLIDSGEVNGTAYYVMPFVEGESLRDRLNREKQLPIPDAIRIAGEAAAALDYAHRHGVIHRDIKPENILLHDGSALVADFGIALAVSSAGGSRMTETGMSLGTPHYMSPEQAMGEREITARSDVYALGAMTYEMLLGEPPFSGPTAQAIVAKVLTEAPRPLTPRRHSIPPEVEDAVLTALQKLPADRFGSAAEFASALQDGTKARRKTAELHHPKVVGLRQRWLVGLGLVVLPLAAFLLGRESGKSPPAPLTFGQSIKVTWDPAVEALPAMSPDGRSVAYASGTAARMRVFVRSVAGGRGLALTDDTSQVQSHPRWSPDGSRVLFLQGGGVFSVPASGGADTPEVPPGRTSPVVSAAWSPDGKSIGYVIGDSLFVRDARNESRGIAGFFEPNACQWSPDGKSIACASGNAISMMPGSLFGNLSPSQIVTVRVTDGVVTSVTDSLSVNQSPIWSPDGRWLYFVSSRYGPRDILAAAMSDGRRTGPAIRVTTGLNAHTISLAADGGRLAFASLEIESNAWSIPLPAKPPATASGETQLTFGVQLVETADISSDGRWLVYDSDLGGNADLYRMALPNGTPERLTTDPSDDFFPDISPDGKEIAFHSWRGGSRDIYVLPLDGGPIQQVSSSPRQESTASWSPDGTQLTFADFTGRGGIWIAKRVDGVWQPPVLRLDHGVWPRWSPDGQFLSFSSNLIRGSIWMMPADSGPPRLMADSTGPYGVFSDQPLWSPDGRSILTRSTNQEGDATFWQVPLNGEAPHLLLTFNGQGPRPSRGGWGVHANRIVYTAPAQHSDVWVMEVQKPND